MKPMKLSISTPRRYSPVELAAAEWLMRRDAGLRPEEERELDGWLTADAEHARVFGILQQTWRVLDEVCELPRFAREPDPDALAPARVRKMFGRRSKRSRAGWGVGLMAAALLVFAAIGAWQLTMPAAYSEAVATDVGGLRKIELPDGSIVLLNTATAIDVQYSAAERTVKLVRGEAHFTVAKDSARPFFVSAGGVRVRAVGTAFNIRLRAAAVEVLVTEGKVRVADEGSGDSLIVRQVDSSDASEQRSSGRLMEQTENELRALVAGELAVIPCATVESRPAIVPISISSVEVERTLAWHDRRLEFAAVPLHEIVAEFNRYNRHQLFIADRALAELRFGGSFQADGYETLVHLLETDHGVIAERGPDKTVLRLAR